MVPNKFEKHINEQLQEREIQPSESAWERLSEKLDETAPPSKKKGYLWYGIAASLIGLLIVSVFYFNSGNSENTPDIQIVDTTDEVKEAGVDLKTIVEKEIEDVVDHTEVIQSPTKKIEIENQTPIVKNQIASVEEIDTGIDSTIEKVATTNNFKEEIINTKILEIVAAVDSLEQNNTVLTYAEVDDLLRNAQEEILRDKLFKQNGSVDAMVLLTEVEDELDKSFRDQIFESLKTGFLKVRTAVADRNK